MACVSVSLFRQLSVTGDSFFFCFRHQIGSVNTEIFDHTRLHISLSLRALDFIGLQWWHQCCSVCQEALYTVVYECPCRHGRIVQRAQAEAAFENTYADSDSGAE